jgi:hypothetical protein
MDKQRLITFLEKFDSIEEAIDSINNERDLAEIIGKKTEYSGDWVLSEFLEEDGFTYTLKNTRTEDYIDNDEYILSLAKTLLKAEVGLDEQVSSVLPLDPNCLEEFSQDDLLDIRNLLKNRFVN